MIPPLPSSTIEANPLFAKLWKHLTVEVLDADASRKSENETRARLFSVPEGSALDLDHALSSDGDGGRRKSQAEKAKLEDDVRGLRISRVKLDILRSMLQDVAYHVDENGASQSRIPLSARQLEEETYNPGTSQHYRPSHSSTSIVDREEKIPSELRDLLLLTTSYLDHNDEQCAEKRLTTEDEELLMDEVFKPFHSHISPISSAVGSSVIELERSLTGLATLTAAADQTYYQPPPPPPASLISSLKPQIQHLSHLRGTTLPNSMAALTTNLHVVLKYQARQLQSSLLQLESSKHGVQSRHAQSRATFIAAVATTMDLKAQLMVLEKQSVLHASGEDTRQWMRTKLAELTKQEARLQHRSAELTKVLAEYEAVDPDLRVMNALGQRYRHVESEIELVKEDIERLEKKENRR